MTFYYKNSAKKWAEKDKIWSEKHEEFCLENRLPPAAKLLWQWLMRQGQLGEELEPDLAEFNEWVAKHRGKGYSRPTLKSALNQLIECRIVQMVKKYTWRIVKIITRPLDWLNPKKKLRNENEIYDLPAPNAYATEAGTQQQQQSFPVQENVSVLVEAGIDFDETDTEVIQRPHNEIKLALIMFELRGGFEKIPNPEGWIRTCLRNRIWEEPRNYQYLLSQWGNLTTWFELFPDEREPVISNT